MHSLPSNQEIILQGTPVSRGIVIAPAHVSARGFSAPEVYHIPNAYIAKEKGRFETALERTRKQLDSLQTQIEQISGEEEGKIFEAHLMILEDHKLLKRVSDAIDERNQNAEYCFYAVMQTYLEAMRRIQDPYLRERAADIEDVSKRLLRNFNLGDHQDDERPDQQHLLIAYDFSPSDTASIDREQVLGIVTEIGSPNSHTAILARSMGIPAIMGIDNVVMDVQALTMSILDGYSGKLILNPSENTLKEYQRHLKHREEIGEKLKLLKEQEAITLDGHKITLSANMEFDHEIPSFQDSGAKGVGLFRTEFFLLENEEYPSEEEQTALYTKIIEAANGEQVIFRTLDAGGDKLPGEPLPEPEPNPFLGWRGIRFSLARPALFKAQIRAILRASAHGKAGIMFPLISGLHEIHEAKAIVNACMNELHIAGVDFDLGIEIGAMIEVPSAAIMANDIAAEVDFLSIGTNDLIQYTIAVDRVNHRVADLYRSTHPAVLRLMKLTVDGARQNQIWTGVCGEMAGDLNLLPLLVGIGVDELSVGSMTVPIVKQAIRSLDAKECRELAREALACPNSREIYLLSREMAWNAYSELLN